MGTFSLFKKINLILILSSLINLLCFNITKAASLENPGGISIGKISPDGTSTWKNYSQVDGLGSSSVKSIFVNENTHIIYAATLAPQHSDVKETGGLTVGIIKTDGVIEWVKTYTKKDGLGDNSVHGVYEKDNKIYAATEKGLTFGIDNGNGSITWKKTYTSTDGLGSDFINSVMIDANNTVFASTVNGVAIKKANEEKFTNYIPSYESGRAKATDFKSIYLDLTNKKIYGAVTMQIATSMESGIYRGDWDGDKKIVWDDNFTYFSIGKYANKNLIKDNTLYVATLNGLFVSKSMSEKIIQWDNYTTDQGLGSNGVADLYLKDDTIYLATMLHGFNTNKGGLSVSKDKGKTWRNYTTIDGLGSNNVSGVYVDAQNTIYLSRQTSSTLQCPDPKKFTDFLKEHGVDPKPDQNGVFMYDGLMWSYEHFGGFVPEQDKLEFTQVSTVNNKVAGTAAACNYGYEKTFNSTIFHIITVPIDVEQPTNKTWVHKEDRDYWICGWDTGATSVNDCQLFFKQH